MHTIAAVLDGQFSKWAEPIIFLIAFMVSKQRKNAGASSHNRGMNQRVYKDDIFFNTKYVRS